MVTASSDARRRGAWLGLALGAVYGLMDAVINQLVLADIPQPFSLGLLLQQVVGYALGAAAVGYITGIPESSIVGVVIGALLMGGFNVFNSMRQRGNESLVGLVIINIALFLPSAAVSAPLALSLRWGADMWGKARDYVGVALWARRVGVWLLVVTLGACVGSFGQYSPVEKDALRQVNTLIRKGQVEATPPASLRDIPDFQARAVGAYTLRPQVELSADMSIAGSASFQSVMVYVVFENGLRFKCLVSDSMAYPLCVEP